MARNTVNVVSANRRRLLLHAALTSAPGVTAVPGHTAVLPVPAGFAVALVQQWPVIPASPAAMAPAVTLPDGGTLALSGASTASEGNLGRIGTLNGLRHVIHDLTIDASHAGVGARDSLSGQVSARIEGARAFRGTA